ncbi:xanthine dehydrogenase family protein molybdopterin-binding subunit [Nocardioides mangrovicus]|uniref:Xanthine dehydrogenase family protein molybdopterin-binding subunit n=1 Tax=Nocardioides mangrovicus TaxID=2478913 RepID=A0A3L8P7F4_9ACTN|nr:aerobic carbon-monoxide dehydrogenase large subunit [Nocardioides mangrovicus]RLV50872.1 xanthine dehydrogenase family protein molybdopterin-binding subunit [Nocardioides mangrovicus]
MTTKLFGTKVPRVEDDRLLRGQGRYVGDVFSGQDALHAAVLRSPHAHARILDIDVEPVLDVEGVVAVYTYDDLEDAMGEPLPLLIPHPTLTHGRTQYALAKDEVNYAGEAVAFVVATDRYVAEDAVARIRVRYEPLPAVVGIAASRAAEHLVHDDVPGNVGARMEQHNGDAPAEIAKAPHTLTLDLDVERSACTPLEGRGVAARWDPDQQRLQVWSSTQTATGVRAAVAAKLGLDLRAVDVITPDVGGGFGVKINHPWPEELLVPLAAMRLGRPVSYVEDRREHFVASAHERAQVQHIEVGFDDEGRLLGLDVMFWHDHGAYTPYGLIVPIITSTQLLGPYKPRAYRVVFESIYTNTVIVTPYRGAGRPQGVYAMERTMDAIAAYLGKDRTEVRAVNFIQPDEFPYEHGLVFQDGRPLTYDSGDYPASLEKIKQLVGWDEFPQYRKEMAAQGRRVGIGLACYVEGTGVGPYEGAHVHIETSGKVKVATGLTSQGQGHQTVFAQLVADELGVRFEDVEVVTGDTRRMPYAVGTFASRAAVMSGSAIHLAAKRAKEKALRIAAEALEADVDDLEITDGVVSVKGAPGASISLGTVAVLSNPLRYAFDEASKSATQFAVGDPDKPPVAPGEEPGLEGKDFYSPERSTFASGMHAVIVETDPDTAEITILKYAVVHDCGHLINPMIVEGQIHGGVAQGVGGALYERMVYDENGQLQNASFMDFLMPYVSEVPETIDIDHLETPSPLNPLGIKGAGEAGVIPSAALFASAIEDAEGIEITAMPISPSDLFTLREEHR